MLINHYAQYGKILGSKHVKRTTDFSSTSTGFTLVNSLYLYDLPLAATHVLVMADIGAYGTTTASTRGVCLQLDITAQRTGGFVRSDTTTNYERHGSIFDLYTLPPYGYSGDRVEVAVLLYAHRNLNNTGTADCRCATSPDSSHCSLTALVLA
jgi:hypothetical protein